MTVMAAGSSPLVSSHASAARNSPGSATFDRSPVSARWSGAWARMSSRSASSSSILWWRLRLTTTFNPPTARLPMKSIGPTPASDPRKCGSVTCASRNIGPRSGCRMPRLRHHLHVRHDAEVIRREHARAVRLDARLVEHDARAVDAAAPITPDLRREDVVEPPLRGQPVQLVDVGVGARPGDAGRRLAPVRARPGVLVEDAAAVQRRQAGEPADLVALGNRVEVTHRDLDLVVGMRDDDLVDEHHLVLA